MKCPTCGEGELVPTTVYNYVTKMRGIKIVIPEAHCNACNKCDERLWSAKEIKKWEAMQNEAVKGENSNDEV